MSYTYEHPRPALTVDCAVFGLDGDALEVLLVQRPREPFRGWWALPGGFARMDETLDQAARRQLEDRTRLAEVYLEQLYTFGDIDRDPRGRVVAVAYYALVRLSDPAVRAVTEAPGVSWFPVDDLPALAFDHHEILVVALERLRGKIRYAPIGFELLPSMFTLSQLQRLYEILLGTKLDKRNFRKKILGMGLLVETDEVETGVAHRAARLYRFDSRTYRKLIRQGFNFAI